MRKAVSGIMLILLVLTSTLTLAFNIQSVKSEPGTIIVPNDYPTIQAAVNAANPGDTIIVRDGTYTENVDVNKSLTIKSEVGAETTIIEATNASDDVIEVTADYVSIKGFTVKGATERCGIHLKNVRYCEVSRNIVSNCKGGILLEYSTNIVLTRNTAVFNVYGIHLYRSHDNNLTGNTANSNRRGYGVGGISLAYSSRNILIGNTASNNTGSGIRLDSLCTYNTVLKNVANLNEHHGILLTTYFGYLRGYNTLSNNIVDSNGYSGITVIYYGDNTLVNNIISNNPCGIRLVKSNNSRIFHNNFKGNGQQVLSERASVNIWDDGYPSGGNYWSDYTGVDNFSGRNQDLPGSDGIGDTPYIIDENNIDRYPLMKPWRARVESPWPMFGHDPQLTGRSPYIGPQTSSIRWTYPTGTPFYTYSPAIATDGTIYSKDTIDGKTTLSAINPSGDLKWKFQPPAGFQFHWMSSPAIGSNGVIYAGFWNLYETPRATYLFAIDPNGNLLWHYKTASATEYQPSIGKPIIGTDGTIYVISGAGCDNNWLFAINPDGTLKWKFEFLVSPYDTPSIGYEGTIYVPSDADLNLYAVTPDGSLKWKYYIGTIPSSCAVGKDGTIYIAGSGTDHLYAINPDGTLKWKVPVVWSSHASKPAIGPNETIIIGRRDWLVALDNNGSIKWQSPIALHTIPSSTPIVGNDGTIYIGSSDGYFYAFNSDGTLKWKFLTGDTILSSGAISSDGTVYVGSSDGKLYAFGPVPPPMPTQPPQPVNLEPPDGAVDVSLEPMFLSSPPLTDVSEEQIPWIEFDGSYFTRVYYHIQITTTPGDYSEPVYDYTGEWLIRRYFDFPPSPKSPLVEPGILNYGTTYYWRIRYKDFRDVWSPWSSETSFTTVLPIKEVIRRLIQQVRIIEKDTYVTIDEALYIIAVLRQKIDPDTLSFVPYSGETIVYIDAKGYAISDGDIARKIGLIDIAQETVKELDLIGKINELRNVQSAVSRLNLRDLTWGGINLAFTAGVDIEKIVEEMTVLKRIGDSLTTIEKIEDLAKTQPLGLPVKAITWLMRKMIWDPYGEVKYRLDKALSDALNEYTQALNLLEQTQYKIEDFQSANEFLTRLYNGQVHEEVARHLLEKTFKNWGKLVLRILSFVNLLEKIPIIKYIPGLEFIALVKEAADALDWLNDADYVYIVKKYEADANLWYKLSDDAKYTLRLAQASVQIQEYNQKYLDYIAEGDKQGEKLLEEAIPFSSFSRFLDSLHSLKLQALFSPGELRVYDSQNRVTGLINGQPLEEIPDSLYDDEINMVIIFNATDTYRYEVVGTDKGSYGLEMSSIANGSITTFTATDIPISTSAIHQYTVDWSAISVGEEGVTVQVDSDGDGVFEHTFTSDSELTHDEFVMQTISWEYIFEDPVRHTILKISTDNKCFRFITPDKDFGIRQASSMYEGYVTVYYNGEYVNLPAVIIRHNDGELRIEAYAGTEVPFCYTRAVDYETGNRYMIRIDPSTSE